MAKTLLMYFLNESGKKVSIRVQGIKDTITDKEISPVMDTIVSKNIFHSKGGDLKNKDSAQIIDRTVQTFTIK